MRTLTTKIPNNIAATNVIILPLKNWSGVSDSNRFSEFGKLMC
jgi:hypothetical protein